MLTELRHRRSDEVGVNLTPLIDVILTLIIFFMLSSKFNRDSQLAIDLPDAKGSAVESRSDGLTVSIDREGRYFVNHQALVNNQPATLRAALEKVAGADRTQAVQIHADGRAPYQQVSTAMDTAGQLGFKRLSMRTEKPAENAE